MVGISRVASRSGPSQVHADWYVEYSHGIRPVAKTIKVDDADMPYEQVLRDPKLNALLSNEGVISASRYPPAAAGAEKSPDEFLMRLLR